MNYDDLDDDIVGEIDLYLSQPPKSSQIHLLQYPLRHAQVGIGNDRRITGVNVRPIHGRFEVKLAVLPTIPVDAVNVDSSFDGNQALAVEKDIGEEQILRSRPNLAAPDSNYAIAKFVPAEKSGTGKAAFTIVPVKSVTQLRPTFDYLDKYDLELTRQKMEEKLARASARGLDVKQNADEDEVEPLLVSFRRRETERAAERRKNSHATLRQKEEGEKWVEVSFIEEKECAERRSQLFQVPGGALVKRENVHDMATTYIDLFYSHTRHVRMGLVAKANTVIDAEPLSARALKMLPTDSAVAQIVENARVVGFRDLLGLVGMERPVNEVMSAVKKVAMCLRGRWVAQKGNKKGLGKLKKVDERYQASRLLVLDLFRQQRVVTEAMAIEALGARMLITEDGLISILKEVAERHRGHGWEFRYDDDEHFVVQYSNLHKEQEDKWEERVGSARKILSNVKR